MNSNPVITVLMPVFNTGKYIAEALESILSQTFTNFELLIIDDASTDDTVNIISRYADSRINLIKKPVNTGYTDSLNFGLKNAKGKYIARMDGDDISRPERFSKQVAFLESNPEIILCGTLYQIIGSMKVSNHSLTHDVIKVKLISGCYIAHPTVMMRREIIDRYNLEYNREMEPAEDYDLWSKMVFLGKFANIGEILLDYRVHLQQASAIRNDKQRQVADYVKINMLSRVLPEVKNKAVLFDLSLLRTTANPVSELKIRHRILSQLLAANISSGIFHQEEFKKFIIEQKQQFANAVIANNNITFLLALNLFFKMPSVLRCIGIKRGLKFLVSSVLTDPTQR